MTGAPHAGNQPGNPPGVHPTGALPPGARPTVTQVPPNGAARPPAVKAPNGQTQHPKAPKSDKREEGGNR